MLEDEKFDQRVVYAKWVRIYRSQVPCHADLY
ncbi:hypothetical protein C5S32_09135 [ANME-1 cluster archaeon GoMg1]|nr:hypothetical protein [ANME-1 cluster archaeon GoMg1]